MEKVTKFMIINFDGNEKFFNTEEEALKAEKEIECYKQIGKKVCSDVSYSEYRIM